MPFVNRLRTAFRELKSFLGQVIAKRALIWDLAKNDFRAQFAGSFFGVLWQFALPIVTMFVFWFVFTTFKSLPVDDIPFMAWFVPAYVPWMFFTESMNGSVSALYQYSYLVKKIRFRTALLPIVKITTSLMVNIFFIGFIFLVMLLYRRPFSPYMFQVLYYMAGLILMNVGIGWLLSSVAVLFKDLGPLVNVVTQLGFWLTPIFWVIDGMPAWVVTLEKFNPMYYVTRGFRDSFLYETGFWNYPWQTLYFWCFVLAMLAAGAYVFHKLRPHFADVL